MIAPASPVTPPNLIETMRRDVGGQMPLLEGHLRRLRRSSQQLGHVWPGEDALRSQVATAVVHLNPDQAWRVRLLLTPDGQISLETGVLAPVKVPLKVVLQGPRAQGSEAFLLHKTTHRPWYESATQWLAAHPDVFDVLYWNDDGQMSEGSRSNVYMRAADGRWLTPPLATGVLPGVQRQALLEAGLVHEAPIHRDAFMQATAWRISNALRGWVDVILAS